MTSQLFVGDCLAELQKLPDSYVHTCVTSPPYWGLRSYAGDQCRIWGGDPDCQHIWIDRRYYTERGAGSSSGAAFSEPGQANADRVRESRWRHDMICHKCLAWYGALGLEPTPELYVEHLVRIFHELHRVLREDGTFWLNIGDSYAGSGGAHANSTNPGISRSFYRDGVPHYGQMGMSSRYQAPEGMKPKDLVGIPWMLAFALRADGWYLRSDIIWNKPNCKPESAKDRPTRAHEYLFLLTKSEKYFYDYVAVLEPAKAESYQRSLRGVSDSHKNVNGAPGQTPNSMNRPRPHTKRGHADGSEVPYRPGKGQQRHGNAIPEGLTRNKRSVWTIAPKGFKGAHFAVFPEALVEPCILAGTSEKGCCPNCGKPWERVTRKEFIPQGDVSEEKGIRGAGEQKPMDSSNGWDGYPRGMSKIVTIGWRQACDCKTFGEVEQCIVLDPFAGSGTTLVVAERLGREGIGIELSQEYAHLIEERLEKACPNKTMMDLRPIAGLTS